MKRFLYYCDVYGIKGNVELYLEVKDELEEILTFWFNHFYERKKEILKYIFGLDNHEALSVEETARKLNVTKLFVLAIIRNSKLDIRRVLNEISKDDDNSSSTN